MQKINRYKLKKQLIEILELGKHITLEFNCGNDEAHIVPFIDEKQLDYGELYFSLEELIYVEFNLPSNGEYRVNGTGYLELKDGDIYIICDLEGFMNDWGDDEELMNSLDFKPKKNIMNETKGTYVLLGVEYDDIEQIQEPLIENEITVERKKSWWKFWE